MRKKLLLFAALTLLLSFAVATAVHAAATKYSFEDVVIDGQTVEIEASVKTHNKKPDFSQCTYFSEDYQSALGYYSDDVNAGDTAGDVLDFCVSHFDERTQ